MQKLASLDAWTRSRELSRTAYKLTLEGTLSRHFGLADQIRRAAAAVPANIAEGYALATTPQFIRCLRIALGSATELCTHLELAFEMGLIRDEEAKRTLALCNRVIALLIGLLRRLGSRYAVRRTLPASPFPLPD
ncbi:MAG TPA: four helix bundle protein [Gemmatimonadales bacterium]|nr:four helix bundle protein [Gemmatimonadales bacterium]